MTYTYTLKFATKLNNKDSVKDMSNYLHMNRLISKFSFSGKFTLFFNNKPMRDHWRLILSNDVYYNNQFMFYVRTYGFVTVLSILLILAFPFILIAKGIHELYDWIKIDLDIPNRIRKWFIN